MRLTPVLRTLTLVSVLALGVPATGAADEVTDWNAVLIRAMQTAATSGALQGRLAAIVHVAMFDAYNGVERRYTPIHVTTEAPRGASGPVPPGGEIPGLNMLVPSLATTLPFAIPSPSSFRSTVGPPALTSAQYAAEVNEIKSVGEATSATRTADQTESARFWNGTAVTFWNRTAAAAADARHNTLSENARLFALLNVAMADAVITSWDAKIHFLQWRPITAIRLANTDGNDATVVQATWTPLIVTPPYPDYDSGHQSISGAAQAILTSAFGAMPVEGISESLPGVVRKWSSFAAAADEASLARIWSGIHFRSSMSDARTKSERIAAYVLEHTAVRLNGRGN